MTVKRVKGISAPKGAQKVVTELDEISPVDISEDDLDAEAFASNAAIETEDFVFSSGVDLNNKVSEPRD